MRVWLENVYSRPFWGGLGNLTLDGTQYQPLPKVESTGHNGSSAVLIMLLSSVVPEKLPGQKGVTKKMKKKKDIFLGVFDVFLK